MTDPDQTPILNRIDRALHAVRKRDPAEAVAAYRAAAATCPTITGAASATEADPCACEDGTGTCKYRRIDGGLLWECRACRREWIVADPATPEEDDTGYWSTVVMVLAVFGSLVVLGIGFVAGYVARGWWA